MTSYQRSFSYDHKSLKKRSMSNSIFGQAWSLFVGREEDKCLEATDTPQAHQEFHLSKNDAWTQASFTALALVFVFITGCMLLSVYYILEPFLHPLLWAVLVGMVLHPFKHASTSQIKDWLTYLDDSKIPLSLGIILSPFFVFNCLAQCFESIFFSNWKMILGLTICTVTMVMCYVFSLPMYALRLAQVSSMFMENINSFMIQTGWLQICSLVVGFLVLLVMSYRYSTYKTALKALSICLWFFALLNIGMYLPGSLNVPLVCSLFLSATVVSLVNTAKKEHSKFKSKVIGKSKDSVEVKEDLLESGLSTETIHKLISPQECELEMDIRGTETPTNTEEEVKIAEVTPQKVETDHRILSPVEEEPDEHKRVSFNPLVEKTVTSTSPPLDSPARLIRTSDKDRQTCSKTKTIVKAEQHKEAEAERADAAFVKKLATHTHNEDLLRAHAQSNQVFLVLFIACFVVILWKYPIFLLIPIPLTLWCTLKYVLSLAVVENSVLNHLSSTSETVHKWFISKNKILFPWPMPTMYTMYLFIDKKVLEGAKRIMGSLVSALIIVLLLVLVLAVAVLVLFQIQVEVMHYAGAAVSVWNTTIASNSQIRGWIGASEENDTLQSGLENFASQNYAYAREKLADWIHTLVSGSLTNTTMMEQRVLELFDRLYSVYVVQNTTDSTRSTVEVITEAYPLSSDDESILSTFTKLLPLVKTDAVLTVLTSLWSILMDNLVVVFSFLYTLLQLLFSGGTVLFNSIVFLTVLFYLLSYSEQDYLPVKWVMDLLPHLTSSTPARGDSEGGGEDVQMALDHGEVFSRAIRSVFHATLRRAFFYGLYNWLTHTLFGLPVSILPAVLAGLAGAIPFIGAYWVALPAVLELWLLQGHLLSALTLFALSLLPVFFVDTLINREIEGGHPYLTGLAIAGGIYFAGLEGALIGPILLSCLLFVVNFYNASLV